MLPAPVRHGRRRIAAAVAWVREMCTPCLIHYVPACTVGFELRNKQWISFVSFVSFVVDRAGFDGRSAQRPRAAQVKP